ncbi:unnamed protein product [Ectocarpus sp. 12 AP-2014]
MNRARERVRDDAALVGEVASKVSAALGLDKANRTLGRNLVIAGLDSNIAAISAAAAASEGGADIGTDAGAAIQQQQQQQQRSDHVGAATTTPLPSWSELERPLFERQPRVTAR